MRNALGVGVLILVAVISNLTYPQFFSPIYVWEVNIPVDQSHSTSRLTTNNGQVYWEKALALPGEYEYGRQIGRTSGGMRIYEVKGDRAHHQVMLTGFMFPNVIFHSC